MRNNERLQIAIEEFMETELVQKWADGVLKAYGLDPNSPSTKAFRERETRKYAMKIMMNKRFQ